MGMLRPKQSSFSCICDESRFNNCYNIVSIQNMWHLIMSGYAEIKHFSAALRILYSWAKDHNKSTYICIFILKCLGIPQIWSNFWTQVCYKYYFTRTVHLHLVADIVRLIMTWVLLSDVYIIIIVISVVVLIIPLKCEFCLEQVSLGGGTQKPSEKVLFATIFLEKLAEI